MVFRVKILSIQFIMNRIIMLFFQSDCVQSRLHFLLLFDPIYYRRKFFFRFLERISFMVKDFLWLYFEWKLNISALRWRFWRVESLRNSRRRRRSVQVNKHFMANIYAVYCAVKLVLLRKGRVMCDIFKETVLFLKWRYLRKSGFQKVY